MGFVYKKVIRVGRILAPMIALRGGSVAGIQAAFKLAD